MNIFSNETQFENSEPPIVWILPKLYELCDTCCKNPLQNLE